METNASSLKPASSKASPTYRSLGVALTLGLTAWFGATVVGVAHADAPPQTTETAHVTYADLDLSTQAGARALLKRIDVAAKTACGEDVHSPLLPREGAKVRDCVNDAVDSAVAKLGSPMVAGLRNIDVQSGVTLAAR